MLALFPPVVLLALCPVVWAVLLAMVHVAAAAQATPIWRVCLPLGVALSRTLAPLWQPVLAALPVVAAATAAAALQCLVVLLVVLPCAPTAALLPQQWEV